MSIRKSVEQAEMLAELFRRRMATLKQLAEIDNEIERIQSGEADNRALPSQPEKVVDEE